MKKTHKKLEIILADKVEKLGKKGDVIKVAKGYAINYLIPQSLAFLSSDHRAKMIIREINTKKKSKSIQTKQALGLAEKLDGVNLEIKKRVGAKGKLFGSVTKKEILKELEKKVKIKLNKADIISNVPIKKIGNCKLKIKLATDIEPEINIKIIGEIKPKEKSKVIKLKS